MDKNHKFLTIVGFGLIILGMVPPFDWIGGACVGYGIGMIVTSLVGK